MAGAVIFKTLHFLTLIYFISCASSSAFAKPPVLVEVFGNNNCSFDSALQEDMLKLLKQYENVILVNCRSVLPDQEHAKYGNSFCLERSKGYEKKINAFGASVTVIVNGQWDAFYEDVAPAIEMGESDNIQKISISMPNDNLLDISVPAANGDNKSGVLLLHIYTETEKKNAALIDADIALTHKLLKDISQNKSVPFVTPSEAAELYVRPIVTMEEIGHWNGTSLNISFPLDKIKMMPFLKNHYKSLSYVVSLHDGDTVGPVLAAGELISPEEVSYNLPHSTPLDLQFISQPNPALDNPITQ